MNEALVRGLFEQAAQLPAEERTPFLQKTCGGDSALRHEIEDLLAADARAANESFWHRSALHNQIIADASSKSDVGETVGRYRLIELIGRGGMGAVYRGERVDAEFEQCVAVKLIDGLFNSAETIAHFRTERQILAHLEHPNIARLFDGGTRADGLPYLVMEYIKGVTPCEYSRQESLSIAERLALFCEICSAVHFAHQHMVIHRDLKPANILVTPDGTPKLLDFGIAKIVDPDALRSRDAQTARGIVPLTARYASPEQIRGEPVTTASDIYSLGVILHELLCGHSPYGDAERAPHQIMSAVCDEDPARPSSLAPKLRGDLDNIVLRAMRKAPQERYGSADQFSADIRRYLEGRPVEARGNSLLYVATKFIRRNRAITAVAGLLLCALIGGLVMVSLARAQADRRFDQVRQLAHSVLFDYADAIDRLPGALPVRQRMVRDALIYLDSLASAANTPQLQRDVVNGYVKITDVEGNEYQNNLGDTAAALTTAHKAVAEADELLTKDRSLATLDSAANAFIADGSVLYSAGDLPRADAAYQRALGLRTEIAEAYPHDIDNQIALAECLDHLGDLYGGAGFANLGRIAASLAYYQHANALTAQLAASNSDNVEVSKERYETLIALSAAENAAGSHQQAARDLGEAGERITKVLAAQPHDTNVKLELANVESRIGKMAIAAGHDAEAIPHMRQSLALLQAMRAADPFDFTIRRGQSVVEGGLATALRGSGKFSEGVGHYEKSLQLAQALSNDAPKSAQYRTDVGIDERHLSEGLLAAGDAAAALRRADLAIAVLCRSRPSLSDAANPDDCASAKRAASNADVALHDHREK